MSSMSSLMTSSASTLPPSSIFLHSHVLNLNVLHELIDDVLGVHSAPVQLLPPLVLLHGASVYPGVGRAGAGVPEVGRVLRAVPAVRLLTLLADVARRALAPARGVA